MFPCHGLGLVTPESQPGFSLSCCMSHHLLSCLQLQQATRGHLSIQAMRPTVLLWALGLLLQAQDSEELISPRFTDCAHHFHNEFIPTLTTTYTDLHQQHRYEPTDICQQFGGKIYYATRYDKKLFSRLILKHPTQPLEARPDQRMCGNMSLFCLWTLLVYASMLMAYKRV